MNKDKLNNLLVFVSILVIVISLLNISTTMTGRATDPTAVVNVTVVAVASINFSTDFFDFGVGEITLGSSNATLESNDSSIQGADGNWSYPSGNGSFVLENIGNKNATIDLKVGKSAASFIGGTGPSYDYAITNNDPTSCNGSANITLGAWENTQTYDTRICDVFEYADARDSLNVSIQLVIPSDSSTGELTDTFTATATGV